MKDNDMKDKNTKTHRICWRNKWLTSEATTITEMVEHLRNAATSLEAMAEEGVTLEYDPDSMADDYAELVTTDPEVANTFSMVPDHDCDRRLSDDGEFLDDGE
jgi:hypothetical protein